MPLELSKRQHRIDASGLPCLVHYGSFASPVRPAHGGGIRLTFSFVTGTRLHGSICVSALLDFSHDLRAAVEPSWLGAYPAYLASLSSQSCVGAELLVSFC